MTGEVRALTGMTDQKMGWVSRICLVLWRHGWQAGATAARGVFRKHVIDWLGRTEERFYETSRWPGLSTPWILKDLLTISSGNIRRPEKVA